MSSSNCKLLAVVLLAGLVVVLGGTSKLQGQERRKAADAKDANLVKGTLASVDADKNTVTITTSSFNRATQERTDTNKTYTLTKDAKVLQDEVAVKLNGLKKDFPVTIKLDGDKAASVSVDGGTSRGEFQSANADRNTITVIAGRDRKRVTFHLLKTTKVVDAAGKDLVVKDLKMGTPLVFTLSIEGDGTAVRVQAPEMK
jgi:hypothetical protein